MAQGGSPQFVSGGGSGRDDTVEALLSDGEYVMDAESVALLGDGSLDEGAARLDAMRENLRKHKGAAMAKGKFTPAAKAPEQYLAKGGRPLNPSRLPADMTIEEKLRRLEEFIRNYRSADELTRKRPEPRGYDPYNKPREGKARGGVIDISGARNRAYRIKEAAKATPAKKAETGAVGELARFADRLEAALNAKQDVTSFEPERAEIMEGLGRTYAKGGEVGPDIVQQILEKYRPKRQYSPEELRQLAEQLRQYKPQSEVLRQFDSSLKPRVYRPSELQRRVK